MGYGAPLCVAVDARKLRLRPSECIFPSQRSFPARFHLAAAPFNGITAGSAKGALPRLAQ